MPRKASLYAAALGCAALLAGPAAAADFSRLGGDLTPAGAEAAGNADGSIPAWSGGLSTAPAGFQTGQNYVDPFPNDKPIARITAANVAEYGDKISPGHKAMFAKYPDTYFMDLYETRRTMSLPSSVTAAAKAQAPSVELTDGGNGLGNLGDSQIPFPIPSSGVEVIWNHIARYKTPTYRRWYTQVVVQANGAFTPVKLNDLVAYFTALPKNDSNANMLLKLTQQITSPPRLEGNILLVHEPIDQVKQERGAWLYNAGQRRVRRAPQIAYDGPGTASEGARTTDDFDMFNGAPDRYNWKLIGKQELIVPYNAYRLGSSDYSLSDIFKAGHINQDLARYELHRVWVVEATLKEGARHIYAKRVFYIDEDSWTILVAEQYDGRDELWRVKEGHILQAYDVQVPWLIGEILYDLQAARYLTLGLANEERQAFEWGAPAKDEDFTPSALRRAGRK